VGSKTLAAAALAWGGFATSLWMVWIVSLPVPHVIILARLRRKLRSRRCWWAEVIVAVGSGISKRAERVLM